MDNYKKIFSKIGTRQMKMYQYGWVTCAMLIVMSVLTLLAMNSYQASSSMLMLARARYHSHQCVRLTEGLLKYGTILCRENKELLLQWGMQDERTMSMCFEPWPTEQLVKLCGRYTGLLSVMSKQGILYVHAQLVSGSKIFMSGLCTLELEDAKNMRSNLYISSWKTTV